MKIRINFSDVWFYFSLAIMIEPLIFTHLTYLHYLYKICQYVIFFIVSFICIKKGYFKNKLLLAIIMFYSINFIITIIFNLEYILKYQYDIIYSISFCELIVIRLNENFRKTIDVCFKIFNLYVIINFILLLLYPNGLILEPTLIGTLSNYYFLGLDNQFAWFIMPCVILAMLNYYINGKFKISLFSILICLLTIFITWSATAVASIVLFVILSLLVLLPIKRYYFKIKMNYLLYIYISFFTLFVILRNLNFPIISDLIINFLGKNLTFSGRTVIWNEVIKQIFNSPLIGYGANEGRIVMNTVSHISVSSHNVILQILFESGIIGLFSFINIFLVFLNKFKNKHYDRFMEQVSIGVFCILITMTMEVYNLEYLFIIILIGYFYKKNYIIDRLGEYK